MNRPSSRIRRLRRLALSAVLSGFFALGVTDPRPDPSPALPSYSEPPYAAPVYTRPTYGVSEPTYEPTAAASPTP